MQRSTTASFVSSPLEMRVQSNSMAALRWGAVIWKPTGGGGGGGGDGDGDGKFDFSERLSKRVKF